MTDSFDNALNWVYPGRCGLCGLLGPTAICDTCLAEFTPLTRQSRVDVDRLAIFSHYEGRAGQAVRRLKFNRVTSLAGPMAERLAVMYEREFSSSIDVIVPVPLHWTRLFGRGFNQSRLLCQGLPPSLVRPAVLRRVRATKPQSSLSAEERLLTLNGAFRAQEAMAGKDVLLVDDVVTSGTTANECAKVLRAAGAKSVSLLAFAGTP